MPQFWALFAKPSDVRTARAARPRRGAADAGTKKGAAQGAGQARASRPGCIRAQSAPAGAGRGGRRRRPERARAGHAGRSRGLWRGQRRPPAARVAGAKAGVAHRRQDMQPRPCLKGGVQRRRTGGDHSCHPRRQPRQGRCDGLRNRRRVEGDRRHDAGQHDQPAGNTGRFRHACRRTLRLQGNPHAKGRTAGRPNGPGGRASTAGLCERLCANRHNLSGRKAVRRRALRGAESAAGSPPARGASPAAAPKGVGESGENCSGCAAGAAAPAR